ncbi:MAG: LamG domain-containing protein [Pseudomonadota bacterium]
MTLFKKTIRYTFALFLTLTPTIAHAQCIDNDGFTAIAGEMELFTPENEIFYCDGTGWFPMRWRADETRSLVSHWRLDETSGTTYIDSAGSNDGTYSEAGVEDRLGVLDNAAGLSATDDFINAGSDGSLDIAEGTISLWFNTPNPSTTGNRYLLSKDENGINLGDIHLNILPSGDATNPNEIRFLTSNGSSNRAIYSDSAISSNRWTHVVALFGTGGMEMYVNGVLQADNDARTDGMTNQTQNLIIGNLRAGETQDFDGSIDDVRLYDYRLSAEEILDLYESYNVDPDLVAWWKLDEMTGTTYFDSAGFNDAVYDDGASVVSATGIINNAGDFTASDVEANAGNGASLNVATGTLSLWFNTPNAATSSNRYLFGKDASGTNAGDFGLYIEDSTEPGEENRPKVIIQDGGGNNAIVADGAITANAWTHIAVLFGTGGMEMYVNGILQSDTNSNTIGMTNASANAIIGNIRVANTLDFDGDIDDVRLYERRLTAAEIEDLFKEGQFDLGTTNGLVAHWELDETSGTSVVDSTGNAANGTMQSGLSGANDSYTAPNGTGIFIDENGASAEDYIDLNLGAAAQNLDQFTISQWIYIPSFSGVARLYEYSFPHGFNNAQLLADGRVRIEVEPDAANIVRWSTPVGVVQAGQWYHIALAYDHSNVSNDALIYVNGVSQSISEFSGPPSSTGTVNDATTLVLGNRPAADQALNGIMDDFRIYDRVLTPSEVNALYFGARDNGIIGHWKLDETSGTNAEDNTINQNDGTMVNGLNGGDNVQAIINTGINFDGTNDNIRVNNNYLLPEFTLCGWFNIDAGGSDASLMAKYQNTNEGWRLSYESGNIRILDDIGAGGVGPDASLYANAISQQRWYHVCGGINSNTSNFLYLDGALLGDSVSALGGLDTFNGNFYLGQRGNATRFLNGSLDDVRLYNQTLSPNDIQALFEEGPGLETGLIGHWKLDEQTGTIAKDSSGLGNDGIMNGGLDAANDSASGPINTALNFDGSNDYVDVGSPSVLDNIRSDYTICAWINPASFGQGNLGRIVSKHDSGDEEGIELFIAGGNDNIRIFHDNDSGGTQGSSNNDVIVLNVWQHICVAHFDDINSVTIYHNGSDVTDDNNIQDIVSHDSTNLNIGNKSDTSNREFDGSIDDVRIYGRALSASEILELYELRGTLGTGLVGYWRLDETSGTTAIDSSGNNNNGTMENGMNASNDSVDGKVDTALLYDAIDDGINAGSDDSLDNLGPLTICSFIKPNSQGGAGGYGRIFSKEGTGGNLNTKFNLNDDGTTGQSVNFFVNSPGADALNIDGEDGWLSTDFIGRWNHLCVTWNGDLSSGGADVIFYRNGIANTNFNDTNYASGARQSDAGRDAVIGNRGTDYARSIDGILDEVRVYNRVLTPNEIYTLAHCTGPGEWSYNYNNDYKQWCDGFKPIEMHIPATGTGGCTGGQEGSLRYETDRYQACDGNGWVDIGK